MLSNLSDFEEAALNWDLERLYQDLGKAKKTFAPHKRRGLRETEKTHLRGLLCGYSPDEIAQKIQITKTSLSPTLSNTIYRYVETLMERPLNSLTNWRDVVEWLEEEYQKKSTDCSVVPWLPSIASFYGRETELLMLKRWIVTEGCHLIAILGMGGIGKSSLTVKLVHELKPQYDVVIWRSLSSRPPLSQLLSDLLTCLTPETTPSFSTVSESILALVNQLRSHRCLIVLDAVEFILESGKTAGSYCSGYQDYGELLKQIGQGNHGSCLILTSWEKPTDIALLEGKSSPVRSLPLTGLGEASRQILKEKELSSPEQWDKIIEPYRGHPLALKFVAAMIQELFQGDVLQFLKKYTLFLGDFEYLLYEQLNRLSPLEVKIVQWLARQDSSVTLDQLNNCLQLGGSHSSLLAALESLRRRSLVEKEIQNGTTVFTLLPMVRKIINSSTI